MKKIKIQLSKKSANELCDLQERLDKETKSTFFTEGKPREERLNNYLKLGECMFG